MTAVSEVEGSDEHLSLVFGIHPCSIARIAVADALAIVAAQTDAQSGDAVVVEAQGYTIFIGHIIFQWRCRSFMYPSCVGKVVGVQASQQLCLIAEIARAAKKADSCLVPCGGQYGVFAFRTVNREEVQWLMMGIVQAHRHDDMSETQVGCTREGLLNPELLEFHLAAFLYFLFPFAAFLVFFLVGQSVAAMLKFYFRAEFPALAKVITQIDDHMRKVKTAMAGIVLVLFGLTVAAHVVAEEIPRVGHLTIAANAESLAVGMVHHAVTGIDLCQRCRCTKRYCY